MSIFLPGKSVALGCILFVALASRDVAAQPVQPATEETDALFHDGHFHLTNYAQEGTDINDYLKMMGSVIGRSTLFGLPL